MSDLDQTCPADDDGLEIDAREIAPLLGLTPERLMAELRAGQVYHSAEDRDADGDGCLCVTFRYRARIARLIVESDGSMRPEPGRTH